MTDADAAFHVDDVAVLGEPVNERGSQVGVFEKGTPVGKAEVGSDQCGFFLMPLVHQSKELINRDRRSVQSLI